MARPASDASRDLFIDAAIRFLSGREAPSRSISRTRGDGPTSSETPRAEALTVRLVAQLAKRNPATLLFHFPDRTALVAAVAARGFEMMVHDLKAAITRSEPRPLVGVPLAYVRWGMDNSGLFTAMYDPALARGLELAQTMSVEGLEASFIEAGDEPDAARKRARAFGDLLEGKKGALAAFDAALGSFAGSRAAARGTAVHALTALADGLVWQWITERQGTPMAMLRHAEACIRLLTSSVAA